MSLKHIANTPQEVLARPSTAKDQASGGRKGCHVANMVSVFDTASSNVKSSTDSASFPSCSPRGKSNRQNSDKLTSQRHAVPHNKVKIGSSVDGGLYTDKRDPRIQRTLEFFNKGRTGRQVRNNLSDEATEKTQKHSPLPVDSPSSGTTVNKKAGPVKITITSTKIQPCVEDTTRTDSTSVIPCTHTDGSDDEVSAVDCPNVNNSDGCHSDTNQPSPSLSLCSSTTDSNISSQNGKQSSSHGAYTPSRSPSTGSSSTTESPSLKACTIKQPKEPTSPLASEPSGRKITRRRSTPGSRKRTPSPQSFLTGNSGSSNIAKSQSTHALSSTSKQFYGNKSVFSHQHESSIPRSRSKALSSSLFRSPRECYLPPFNRKHSQKEDSENTARHMKSKGNATKMQEPISTEVSVKNTKSPVQAVPPPKVLSMSCKQQNRRHLPPPKVLSLSPIRQRKVQQEPQESTARQKREEDCTRLSNSTSEGTVISVKSRIAMFKNIQQEAKPESHKEVSKAKFKESVAAKNASVNTTSIAKDQDLLPEPASCSSIPDRLPVTEVVVTCEQENILQSQHSSEDEPIVSGIKIVSCRSQGGDSAIKIKLFSSDSKTEVSKSVQDSIEQEQPVQDPDISSADDAGNVSTMVSEHANPPVTQVAENEQDFEVQQLETSFPCQSAATLPNEGYETVEFHPLVVSQEPAVSDTEAAHHGLESIPEYDVAKTRLTPLPFEEPTATSRASPYDREHSSPDSEGEFYRRLSNVTGSFYDEMLASITATIGSEYVSIPHQQGEMGEKEFGHAVTQLVQQNPELAENIYESIEQYKKSSHFIIQDGFNKEEEPPALPPRPDSLRKKDSTDLSVSFNAPFESYVEMKSQFDQHSSPVLCESLEVEAVTEQYEPIFSVQKKKRKNIKRSLTLMTQAELEKKTFTSGTDDSKQTIRKKSRLQGFFSRSKTEPCCKDSRLRILDKPQLSAAHFSSVTEYEVLNSPLLTVCAANDYANVSRNSNSLPLTNVERYNLVPTQHYISPTQTSESEDSEDDSSICSITSTKNMPRNVKVKTSSLPRIGTRVLSQTPDSGFYPELSPTHSTKKLTRDLLTPPRITKLSVSSSNSSGFCEGIPTSTSDHSIHKLMISNRAKMHPSFELKDNSSPTGSLTRLTDLATDSDPDSISLDSSRGERFWLSPVAGKRYKSASPEKLSGSVQKEQLLAHARRRGSSIDKSEVEDCIVVPLVLADAVMDRTSIEHEELGFAVNDVIAVLDMTDDDWWQGMVNDKTGWFPASWVRLRIGQDTDDSSSEEAQDDGREQKICKNESVKEQEQTVQEVNSDDSPDQTSVGTNGVMESSSKEETREETISQLTAKSFQQSQGHCRKGSRRMTITRRATLHEHPRKLSSTEVRARCVQEILTTEKQYVQHLRDIIEGYLHPCQQHNKLFTAEQTETIFSNIEDIYQLQVKFLSELEAKVVLHKMEDSLIGQVFMRWQKHFATYSDYCSNHPHAVNEMNILQQDSQYAFFFESCRLLRNLTGISLDGFLLTPVQKICKYPLQLAELLKYTPEDHPDYHDVFAAQEAMKDVALLVNERKRRVENIAKVVAWQNTIDNWKGEDMIERSTEFIHSGELHKISKGHSQERHFFLFDHQLVYCKKDTIGGRLSHKGRVNMDKCIVKDLSDGEVSHNVSGVRNAWKMRNVDKEKWYILYTKSAEEKTAWMLAFQKERARVAEDEKTGFVVTKKMKQSAAALNCDSVPQRNVHTLMRKSDWVTESVGAQPSQRLESFASSPGEKKKIRKKR